RLAVRRALGNALDAIQLRWDAEIHLGFSGVPRIAREGINLALDRAERPVHGRYGKPYRPVDSPGGGAPAGAGVPARLATGRRAVGPAVAPLGASRAVGA